LDLLLSCETLLPTLRRLLQISQTLATVVVPPQENSRNS
jgi:hypothetical protein